MIGVLGQDNALVTLYWAGDNYAHEMNFVINHAPGARSIARIVDQQSTTVPRTPPILRASKMYFKISYIHPMQIVLE